MDLAIPGHQDKPKAAVCLGLNSLTRNVNLSIDGAEDNLVVCSFAWKVFGSGNETVTYHGLFDLNQWYKEQMPSNNFSAVVVLFLMSIYCQES